MDVADDSLTANEDLSDTEESTSFELAAIDFRLLTSSVVLAALGGLAIGIAVLVWPERSDRVLARVIGLGFAWSGLAGLRGALQHGRPGLVRALVGPVLTLAVGVFLIVEPDRSTVFIGRVVGALVLLYVARELIDIWRRGDRDWTRLPYLGVVAALGLTLLAVTGELLGLMIGVCAVILIAVCLLVLVVSLDARTEGVADYRSTSDLVMTWLRDRPKSLEARQDLYAKILYEGPTTQTRVIRFFALMGFAAVIASMGVITDSTAVVIGAMLVAPLMTPLMGMAVSLVMGWPNRLLRSASLAFGGIAFAIAIGVVLGLVTPADIDTATNTQILARTTPTMLDMITAIAAGGAGAYGLSRPDVSDSLPGVAIAISLVPPLSVVGISYSQGDVDAGNGALLLFSTNMIAILIVGGLTFILTGVTPIDHAAKSRDRMRVAIGATLTVAIIVLSGLLLNGAQLASDALRSDTVDDAVKAWIPADTGHRLVAADIEGDVVTAVVIGPADGLGDVAELAADLSDEFDTDITVKVSLVVEERFEAIGTG